MDSIRRNPFFAILTVEGIFPFCVLTSRRKKKLKNNTFKFKIFWNQEVVIILLKVTNLVKMEIYLSKLFSWRFGTFWIWKKKSVFGIFWNFFEKLWSGILDFAILIIVAVFSEIKIRKSKTSIPISSHFPLLGLAFPWACLSLALPWLGLALPCLALRCLICCFFVYSSLQNSPDRKKRTKNWKTKTTKSYHCWRIITRFKLPKNAATPKSLPTRKVLMDDDVTSISNGRPKEEKKKPSL